MGVEFVREERFAGETKYLRRKMIKFAANTITSFSYKPLRIATYIGCTISLFSFLYLLAAISLFFNGVILMMLGIIGEYIGRIYEEAQARPLYIISDKKGF